MAKQTFTTGQVLTAAQMTSLQQTAMGGGSTTAKTTSYVLVAADAGTVVQMNAAGSTTITVNTALFSAGDSVQIQNVGAGVCTITAGTATVSTSATLILKQYDAGTLYFNSASAAIFFASDAADSPLTTKGDLYTYSTTNDRLAVGANGTTLVADSTASTGLKWATPTSSTLPTFSAYKSAADQTFSAGTWTKVTFDVENWDSPGCFASSTFTPTSAGYYSITAASYHQQVNNGDFTYAVYKNGTNWQRLLIYNPTIAGNSRMDSGQTLVYCNGTTDYIEIYARGDGGGNVTLYAGATLTYFSAIGIRA